MTVATEIDKSGPYAGAGTTGPFTVGFRFLDNTHLQVIRTDATGVDTTLAYPADYSVAGVGNPTGTVTTTVAVPAGETLTIIRDVPFTQEADYVQNDDFPAESHETALDKLTMITQQLREIADRSLTLPPSTSSSVSAELPPPKAHHVIGWNDPEDALINVDPASFATIVAYGTTAADLFSGNGVLTTFTLTHDPASVNNMDVAIGGVTQRPGIDYTWSSGTTLTFTVAPPAGANNILVRYQLGLAIGQSDSAASLFIQAGSGAVPRTAQDKMRDVLNPRDWGAKCDNITDDTAALQELIKSIGSASAFSGSVPAIEIVLPWRTRMLIAGTLLLPSFVKINLNGSLLRGIGSNTMFESAFFDANGDLVTNWGQTAETKFVVGAGVYNGNIFQCNRAFHLFNFCEDSEIRKIRMVGVNQAVHARHCFYGSFTQIHSRSPLDGTAFPCFFFDGEVNAVKIDSNFAVSYTQGWQFSGKKDNVRLTNCGAESCPTGIKVSNATSNIQILGCYFENSTNAIDCDNTGNHENVVVSGCWFFGVTNAIIGSSVISGLFSASNKLNGANVSLVNNFSNRMTVEIPTDVTAADAAPVTSVPSNYQLGDANDVEYIKAIYNPSTGLVSNKGRVHSGVIPHSYSGGSGSPPTNTIPFCTASLSGGTTLTIDTSIRYLNPEFVGMQLTITATPAVVLSMIFCAGSVLASNKPGAVTIVASNNGGFYSFVVTGLVGATAFSGVVRIL